MAIYYAAFIPQEDGKVSVLFPDVPGCSTWGENFEHAFTMAVDALAGHLEALADDNDPIPPPSNYEDAFTLTRQRYVGFGLGELRGDTKLHPVPSPNLDTRTRQVAVSFKRYVLDMIDRKAETLGMSRSGFLAEAAKEYEAREGH
jgi:predicted RNase H-like HicB family nuclease